MSPCIATISLPIGIDSASLSDTHSVMTLDIIIALVVAFGVYLGFTRGLIKTVFDTLSLFVGLLATLKLSSFVITFIEQLINNKAIALIAGVVITFIAVMAFIRWVGKKLEDVLQAANINFVNKIAGGALQGMFFALLLSLALNFLGKLEMLNPETIEQSQGYALLEPLPDHAQVVFEQAKPLFSEFWNKAVEAMDAAKDKGDEMLENG